MTQRGARCQVISRADAKASGLERYFTGAPCSHGHIAERYVRNWSCCECDRLRAQTKYYDLVASEEGRKKVRKAEAARHRRRFERNPDKVRDQRRRYVRAYVERGGEELKKRKREYYEKNRDKHREGAKIYRSKNPDYYRDYSRKYSAKIRDLIAVLRKEMPELLREFGL